MVHVAGVAFWQRLYAAAVAELTPVTRGDRAPPRRPARQPRQPRAQHSRLHLVEAGIDSGLLMMIPVGLSAVAEAAQAIRERAIACDDRAAVAERSKILRRVEAA